jgi:hypothetical protein
MDSSSADRNVYAPPADPNSRRDVPARLSIPRFLATSVICGLGYPFAVPYLTEFPLWLTSVFIVCGFAVPVLWILLPQLRLHGFHGVSTGKFMLVSSGFIVATFMSFMLALWVLIAAWPFLGLPPFPSD